MVDILVELLAGAMVEKREERMEIYLAVELADWLGYLWAD